jgi:fatty acid-binding protein DegV
VIHVACPEFVAPVADEIRALYGSDVEIITRPATPVISTHLGVGAWGIAYLNEG